VRRDDKGVSVHRQIFKHNNRLHRLHVRLILAIEIHLCLHDGDGKPVSEDAQIGASGMGRED